jgi:DNA-binding CsgD family transcriptional regulator
MLVGRSAEQRRIDSFLDLARDEVAGSLLIRGDAGIGKTELLTYARQNARGLRIVESRIHESETQLGFAALTALAAPLREHVAELAPRQRAAMESALALGPPLDGDRLAVAAATLSLFELAARAHPMLVLIDDAHWLDGPSREAILFAARRLRDTPLRMLLASRDGETGSLADVGIAEIVVQGLDDQSARELLGAHQPTLTASVAGELVTCARGNPLALVSSADALTDSQRHGRAPLPRRVSLGSAQRTFAAQAAALPTDSRRALLLVCADDSGWWRPVRSALGRLEIDVEALAPVERAGLVRSDGERLTIRHALVRDAAYHDADQAERRSAHAALADAYAGIDPDRRAWHRAEATMGFDEETATALDEVAARACRRGAFASVVPALVRAAELSADPGDAARRRLRAAEAADLAGLTDVVLTLTEGQAPADQPLLQADAALVRGRATRARFPAATSEALREAATAVAPIDTARESALLLEAAMADVDVDIEEAAILAERAVAATRRAGIDPAMAELVHARLLHYAGRPVERSVAVVVPDMKDLSQSRTALWLLGANAQVDPVQQRAAEAVVAVAREQGALGVLPDALVISGMIAFYLGDWDTCVANNDEAIGLAVAVERSTVACDAWGTLARVHAFRGEADDFQRCLAEFRRLAAVTSSQSTGEFGDVYAAEWDLTRGRWDGVVEKIAPTWAARTISRATAALIEAYARTGQVEAARRALAELEERVDSSASVAGRAFVHRLHGVLQTDPDRSASAFDDAVAAAERLGWPLETARTELLYGERLRRDRRRKDARWHLARAADIFDALGARPWAERARQEHDATGERAARRREPDRGQQLTPQELRVARVVAQGASNREAAAHLFISAKTVEMHLSSIYRKLRVSSRTQMVARLSAAQDTGQRAGPPRGSPPIM